MALVNEMHWRVKFDGLYQSVNGGPFRRIATRFHGARALYWAGYLNVDISDDCRPHLDAMLKPRPRLGRNPAHHMDECIAILTSKLRDRTEVIDVHRKAGVNSLSGMQARGFKLDVRGLGTVFAIKPGHLRRWMPGTMPLHRVIRELEDRGWLICGADRGRTRQIVIPGYGRYRFYCLKLAAAGDDGPDGERAEFQQRDRRQIADAESAACEGGT